MGKSRIAWGCVVCACVAAFGAAFAGASAETDFALLKSLEGTWVEVVDGKPTDNVMLSYHVTAGGSAVIETVMPGSDHEMVTVYHRDGDTVKLKHYCVMGNRPEMRSRAGAAEGTLEFECAGKGADGSASEADSHMHSALIRRVSDDRIHAEWIQHTDGKPTYAAKFDAARR